MSKPAPIAHENRGPVRILVADADDDTRSRYRRSLSSAGCDVVDAADGREALERAFTHRPTLIVTDIKLKHFDGYELCQLFRRDTITRSVPILVVTSVDAGTEVDRARDAGADAVLVKPVSPNTLLTTIQQLLKPSIAAQRNDLRRG